MDFAVLVPRLMSAGISLFVAACSHEAPTRSSTTTGAGGGTASSSSSSGIGQPSDVYPAPHPEPPTVVDAGGPVLAAPVIVPVFFKSDDASIKSSLTTFLHQIGATSYWTAT